MSRFLRAATLAVAAAFAAPVFASPASVALTACLVAKSTQADRDALVRWFFVSASVHPAVKDLFDLKPEAREAASKAAADVFVRLASVDCKAETRATVQVDGSDTIRIAFGKVVELAGQDLTASPAVQAQFGELSRYMDRDKLKAAFGAN